MLTTLANRFALDRLALGLSALCLVHCLASVFLVAALAGGKLIRLGDPLVGKRLIGRVRHAHLALVEGAIAVEAGDLALAAGNPAARDGHAYARGNLLS